MSTKYLDYSGLSYFWSKLKTLFATKADKVTGATNGNFAGLDANGNLTDSGKKASDFSKVEASTNNGKVKVDGSDVTVYTHPTTTAAAAAAVKVGKDSDGHVVIGDALAKGDVGLGNVDNTSDASKKTSFTGSIADGDTGFVTGQDVYNALGLKANKVNGTPTGQLASLTADGDLAASGKLATDVTKVEASNTNGNIKIDNVETTVYSHPTTTAVAAAAVKVGNDAAGHVVLGAALEKSDVGLGNVTNDAQVKRSEMGQANGVATLDSTGKVPSSQLPSYVDDVIEVYPVSGATELSAGWLSKTQGGAALTPETGVIYVLMADSTSYSANTQFRWAEGTPNGTYVKLNDGGVSAITNGEIDTIMAS